MREITTFIPMKLTLPDRYEITLKLNGDSSTLEIREFHNFAVAIEMIDKTIAMANFMLSNKPQAHIEKLSPNGIALHISGDEDTVIKCLLGEMDMLSQSLPNQVAFMQHPSTIIQK